MSVMHILVFHRKFQLKQSAGSKNTLTRKYTMLHLGKMHSNFAAVIIFFGKIESF